MPTDRIALDAPVEVAEKLELYEWGFQLEVGRNLLTGEPYKGFRLRHRRKGTRLWQRLLLLVDDEQLPTAEMIIQAIEAHENHGG